MLNRFNKWRKGALTMLYCTMAALSFMANAQTLTVSGTVTNEAGEQLSGVSIRVKGQTKVFQTGDNGRFSIPAVSLPVDLVFTSVGYQSRELNVSVYRGHLDIRLTADAAAMEEVTVMSSGYQDIPKERATGSFVQVDNKMLQQQAGTNILKRLDGLTSSVLFETNKSNPNNPRSNLNISVRGLSTISGPLDPLVVVDGFIYEGSIENINPNDVENITVLRDAAASSIWGARAGNGVIVITTKRGKFNQKLQLGFSSNISISEKPDLYYLPRSSTADYLEVEQFLFHRGYFNNRINSTPFQALSPAVEIFLQSRNGTLTAADSLAKINELKNIDSRQQYAKYFYTPALTQQYALNLRGGSEKNAYIFSVGYDNTRTENDGRGQRLNLKTENSFRPVARLNITIGAYLTFNRSASGRNLLYNQLLIDNRPLPYLRFADDQGHPLPVAHQLRDVYTDTAGAGKLLNWKYYPLEDYKHNRTQTTGQEIFAYTGLNYKVHRFVNLEMRYQYQRQDIKADQLADTGSFQMRNMINRFSQLNRTTGTVKYIVPLGGLNRVSLLDVSSQTLRGQLNINPEWGRHMVSAILGAEARQVLTGGREYSIYGYTHDPVYSTPVDFANNYPDFVTGSFVPVAGASHPGKTTVNRFISYYGNASYAWRKRYIASISMRKDGSNIFGVNTNDRWKPLWSAGVNWKLSQESFYNLKWLPLLGLRATYGYSGNVDLSKTAEAIARYSSSSTVSNLPFARINTLNNPELRWEQIGIFNLALDFAFSGNRVTGAVEYYRKKGTDLYGQSPYDYTTFGLGPAVIMNVAAMQGMGMDLTLNAKILNRALGWDVRFFLSHVANKTTRYMQRTSLVNLLGSGTAISPVVGMPLYAITAYKFGGLDAQGNPQGYLNGELSTDYQGIQRQLQANGPEGIIRYIGPSSPTLFGGLFQSFSYKGFTLGANITYKFGYYFRRPSVSSYTGMLNGGGHRDYDKRWQKPGDENDTRVPVFIYPENTQRDGFYNFAEVHVRNAGHVRLQFVNLDYTLRLGKKDKKLPPVNLYLNIANPGWLWTVNREKIDPDYPNALPPVRMYTLGIRTNL